MLLQPLCRLERPFTYEGQINLAQRRTWFAEEPPTTPPAADEKPKPPPAPTGDKSTPDPAADKDAPPDWVKDPAKAYAEIQKLRDENAGHRKTSNETKDRLDKIEAERKKKEETDLATEKKFEDLAKKAQTERDQALADLQTEKLNSLRTRVGMEFKLPVSLISRLKGSTEDELKADAAALVKDLGLDKPAETPPSPKDKPAGGRQVTTVAPGGPPAGETDAERRARLYKQGPQHTPIFNKPSS